MSHMLGLLEWWGGLHPGWRFGVAIFFLALSTVIFFGFDRFWPWGWAVGGLLLLFSGPSDSEKKGYRF